MKTKYVNFLATALLAVAIVSCKKSGTVTTTKVDTNIITQNEPGKNQPIATKPEQKEEVQKDDLRMIESEISYENVGQGAADKKFVGPSSIARSYHSPAPSMKAK